MATIPRHAGLTEEQFIESHLLTNQPVIVPGVAKDWPAQRKWSVNFFLQRFGDREVQVYDQLFSLIDLTTLADYLGRNFAQPNPASTEYVRWYSRLSDVEIPWSDEVFDALSEDWTHPPFLPTTSYVLPYCDSTRKVSATRDRFPYRGLFLSARGGRTRLHRDPLGSQAILWQVFGRKSVSFYSPKYDSVLRDSNEFVDPQEPDLTRFPGFSNIEPTFKDILEPGEILFVPDGWFHDVVSMTDSLSVTWNLVHRLRLEPLLKVLAQDQAGGEIDVARFFLSPWVRPDATSHTILDVLQTLSSDEQHL